MISWIPIAVNEKPMLRGKVVLPEYSAAVIGSSVVLRAYSGGLASLSLALTTISFPSPAEAEGWIADNQADFRDTSRLAAP